MNTADALKAAMDKATKSAQALSQAEGAQASLLSQLQADFGLSSLEEAQKELKALDDKIAAGETRLAKMIEKLQAEIPDGV